VAVTGSGTTYDVAVSGMTKNGTVIASIAANAAVDAAGNGNTASTSTDNTVTYNVNSAPTATVTPSRCSPGGKASGTLNVKLFDGNGDTLRLTLASNSNKALLPSRNVSFGGGGSNRTLKVTGAAKKSGTAILKLNLSDGTATAQVTIAVKIGNGKANVLNGTAGADMIFGLGGSDRIRGLGGNDLLCGGNGGDALSGGDGNDALDGGNGSDALSGGSGNDRLTGGAGRDTFRGGSGTDVASDLNARKGDTKDRTIP